MNDPFLSRDQQLIRLTREYLQYGRLIIGFDFDHTVYDFAKVGDFYPDVIRLLKRLKRLGCYLICFTANRDTGLVKETLLLRQIPYDSINDHAPFLPDFLKQTSKIFFNALLDDRAGLGEVALSLTSLCDYFERFPLSPQSDEPVPTDSPAAL